MSAGGSRRSAPSKTASRVIASRIDGADGKALRAAVDQLKERLGSAVIVLAAVDGEKITLVTGVTEDLTGRVQAGALVGDIARRLGGKGGGRADFAQAGGNDIGGLEAALATVVPYVRERLAG